MESITKFISDNAILENVYIVGSAALYLNGYTQELPPDYDILVKEEVEYNIPSGVDCIPYNLALLADGYKDRAIEIGNRIYALSVEDIVVNMVSGYQQRKHRERIAEMTFDVELVKCWLSELRGRKYIPVRQELFENNIDAFLLDFA